MEHLDLLFGARRLWKLRFESCRLVDLENQMLGVEREGDLPGELIPYVYFEYLRTRQAARLVPIFEHNALDILSLACLTGIVPYAFQHPARLRCAMAAKWPGWRDGCARRAIWKVARRCCAVPSPRGFRDDLLFRAMWDLAQLERKLESDPGRAGVVGGSGRGEESLSRARHRGTGQASRASCQGSRRCSSSGRARLARWRIPRNSRAGKPASSGGSLQSPPSLLVRASVTAVPSSSVSQRWDATIAVPLPFAPRAVPSSGAGNREASCCSSLRCESCMISSNVVRRTATSAGAGQIAAGELNPVIAYHVAAEKYHRSIRAHQVRQRDFIARRAVTIGQLHLDRVIAVRIRLRPPFPLRIDQRYLNLVRVGLHPHIQIRLEVRRRQWQTHFNPAVRGNHNVRPQPMPPGHQRCQP